MNSFRCYFSELEHIAHYKEQNTVKTNFSEHAHTRTHTHTHTLNRIARWGEIWKTIPKMRVCLMILYGMIGDTPWASSVYCSQSKGTKKWTSVTSYDCSFLFKWARAELTVAVIPVDLAMGPCEQPRPPLKLKALVYDILPPTTTIIDYTLGLRKLSANGQFFIDAQTTVSS